MTSAAKRTLAPRLALAAAGASAVLLVGALVWRIADRDEALARADDASATPVAAVDAAPATTTDAAAVPAPIDYDHAARPQASLTSATITKRDQGVDIGVHVELDVPPRLHPRDYVWLEAKCYLDGQWFSGARVIDVGRWGAGRHPEAYTIEVGRPYRFAKSPATCQLGVRHMGYDSAHRDDPWVAKACVHDDKLVAGACAPTPMRVAGKPVIDVTDVRLQTRGYSTYEATVTVAAIMRTALRGWSLQTSVACALPGGATARDARVSSVGALVANAPFSIDALMFLRKRMSEAPTACAIALALVDEYAFVSEPVAVYCWRGSVTPGPCPADP